MYSLNAKVFTALQRIDENVKIDATGRFFIDISLMVLTIYGC